MGEPHTPPVPTCGLWGSRPSCQLSHAVPGSDTHSFSSFVLRLGILSTQQILLYRFWESCPHEQESPYALGRAIHRSLGCPRSLWDTHPRQPWMSPSSIPFLGCPPMPGSSLGWPPTKARAPGFPPAPACRMGCPPTPVPSLGWPPTPGGAQSIPRGVTQTRSAPAKAPVACGTAAHGSPGQHWDGHPRHSPPPKESPAHSVARICLPPSRLAATFVQTQRPERPQTALERYGSCLSAAPYPV